MRLRRGAAVAIALVLAGCTPVRTTLWPYSDDADLDARLAKRAAAFCECRRAGTELPPRPFTTDGCSMSPDEDWVGCCVAHDFEYWCGGSAKDRRAADDRLALCVEGLGHGGGLACTMRSAVRVGGAASSPLPWRWGYGWSEIRGYDETSNPGDAEACFGR